MSSNPLHQFEIQNLVGFQLGGFSLELTNIALFMLISLVSIISVLYLGIKNRALIPGKLQIAMETLYNMIDSMLEESVGAESKKFIPFFFSLFLFILTCNLLGLIPHGFTVTSHIATTFALASVVFLMITILGFIKQGIGFLRLFFPHGTPLFIAPILVIIELFSYLARPVSLSIRLTANMMAGHIVLKVIGSFVFVMGALGVLPFTLLTILSGFEIFVAILQAYIFTILSCVYLGDAYHSH